jgi:hypothetical protein
LALSYSVLDAARHPSQGGCCAPGDTQENANNGTVVTQSQGVNPVALVLWNILMARINSHDRVCGLMPPTPPANVLPSIACARAGAHAARRNQPPLRRSKSDVRKRSLLGPVQNHSGLLNFRVVLLQRFTQSSQRFIDRPLPLRDFMPFAGHLAIAGLDLWIGHSRGSTLALIRLLPTDIGPASHDASSRSALT